MKLALVGYGKMGRMLERLAPEFGFEAALILDEYNNVAGAGLTKENFAPIDVAIEFSTPRVATRTCCGWRNWACRWCVERRAGTENSSACARRSRSAAGR